MRLSVAIGGEALDLEIDAVPHATVGDLVAALAGGDGDATWLRVEGALVPPTAPLHAAGLHDGVTVALAGTPRTARVPSSVPAGLEPGPRPEVPADHAAPRLQHATTWWRPPRQPLPPEPPPVEPAAEPPAVGEPPRLSWPALVAPAAVAAALALLLDPRLAVIALVGPVAQLATWFDDRHRLRRQRNEAEVFRAAEADRVARDSAAAAAASHARHLAAAPHVGELAGWATQRHPRLWERRIGDADFLRLRGIPDGGSPLVVGIDGDRSAVLAVARNLVTQAAVLHGPADLGLVLAAGPDEVHQWDWAKWLPHLRTTAPQTLAVVDVAGPGRQRGALAEAGAAAMVIVAAHPGVPLPDACRVVLDARAPSAEGLDESTARRAARALAPLRDPDAVHTTTAGPTRLLRQLEALPPPTATFSPVVRLGTGADGRPFTIDLAADGPHVLIAGTTGSGKSELLRGLVASLAASAPPEAVNFVLVDYKGGSAFDACARLPHVAGVVTDLDDELAARALRCLEAELRYRERVLRATGAPDIDTHNQRGDRPDVLPRLVIVIDEFAALAADAPAFVPGLVGIAQRGRSLGVHLVLATQRPAGVVNDAIRANIGLRIALRVQDAGESTDVIGTPRAAAIPKDRPGRGIARFDAERLVSFDTAMISCAHEPAPPPVTLRPFTLGSPDVQPGEPVQPGDAAGNSGGTDLDVLVATLAARARERDAPPPRRPWPEPLPPALDLTALPADHALGLADDPDQQAQPVYAWRAANLLACGAPGSGAGESLVTLAHSLARATPPSKLHIYAVDNAARALAPLTDLPHTGAVVGPGDLDRQARLLRTLSRRIDEPHARAPGVLLLLADLGALVTVLDDRSLPGARDELARIVADGAAAGIHVAAAVTRPGAVAPALAAGFPTRLVFRLTDPQDAAFFGARALRPTAPPGRAVDVETGLEVQIAVADPAVRRSARAWPRADQPPAPVGTLPSGIAFTDLASTPAPAAARAGDLWLPIGIADDDLAPCGVRLGPGDHAMIAGGPRTGKTALLAVIAAAASRLARVSVTVTDDPDEAGATAGACLLLVDDADTVDDSSEVISRLIAARRPDLHVIAAGRTDALRTAYGHWTRDLRRAATGVLLAPRPDDGDLFGVLLPRARGPFPAGRGYVITDGIPHLFQSANLRQ